MKIQKLFISNFKNIREPITIDFEKNITLLVGPNGFGKTTIFDAIELALTGMIYRISKSNITDKRSTFEKAYFQNDINKDVVIRLLMRNDNNDYLTVERRYKKNLLSRGIKLCPEASLKQFKLRIGDEDSFYDFSNLNEGDQSMINKFIGFRNNSYKIQYIYNLFNYIQQEDTDYYLRRSEKIRKDTLSFLLQIDDYQEKKLRISTLESKFGKIKASLSDQEKAYGQNHLFDVIKYESLPVTTKREHKLNSEDVEFGQELTHETLNAYMEELDKLIDFRQSFSPDEFKKKKQREQFQKEILDSQELINYLVLQNLISDKQTSKRIIENQALVTNENNYSSYLLKNYIDKIEFLDGQINLKSNLAQFKKYLYSSSDTMDNENLAEYFEKINSPDSLQEIMNSLTNILESYLIKNKEQSNAEDDCAEINVFRDKLKDHYLPDDKNHTECVLCGYDWKNNEKLRAMYEKVDLLIKNNLSEIQKSVSDLRFSLEEKKKELIDSLCEMEKKLIIVDSYLINELRVLENNEISLSFERLAASMTDIQPLKIKPLEFQEYIQIKDDFRKVMENELLLPAELYSLFEFSRKNNELFKRVVSRYPTISDDILLNHQISSKDLPLTTSAFELVKKQLIQDLVVISENINYDFSKINDPTNLFEEYFNNQKSLFDLCTKEKLLNKKKYIEFKFKEKRSIKLTKIKDRLNIIESAHSYLDKRNKKLDENIKQYQQEMIDILKLPFFLYTAKILQNYQQGMGVLLTTRDKNANIRFLTNSYSEQDAMYQLSSGQIAVISFAFTLSLNKTFKISEGLKILAIDDPIQDMDAMNVHALIDLLRHSLPDYQLIMSTHSDSSAMFIKYKFDLMSDEDEDNVNLINAKSLFLER